VIVGVLGLVLLSLAYRAGAGGPARGGA
jgi:hypothetical protein